MCKYQRAMFVAWNFTELTVPRERLDGVENDETACFFELNFTKEESSDLKSFIQDNQARKNLILLHTNEPNYFDLKTNLEIELHQDFQLKIAFFGGGIAVEHPIYFNNAKKMGILNQGGSLYDGEIDVYVETKNQEMPILLKKEHFDYVWDYYWNWGPLDRLRQHVYNILLPLAIHMAGAEKGSNSDGADLKTLIEGKEGKNLINCYEELSHELKDLAPLTTLFEGLIAGGLDQLKNLTNWIEQFENRVLEIKSGFENRSSSRI